MAKLIVLFFFLNTETVFESREFPGPHVLGIGTDRHSNILGEIGVAFDKLGLEVIENTQHVFSHQNLPITSRRSTNPDGRNANAFSYLAR